MEPENDRQRQERTMLQRVAFSYMKHQADAEDAVQETFVRLLEHAPEFESEEHRRAWLLRTLINICRDMLKSAWRRRTVGLDSVDGQVQFVLPYGIQDETFCEVMELDERYRVPLYLFYYEGYSIAEIAGMLEQPESTVKTHLRRGRGALRMKLEKK